MGNEQYRLLLNGQPEAWAEGPNAVRKLEEYAQFYGIRALRIQQRVGKRWKDKPHD